MRILALILAGIKENRLDILSAHRAKPAVPFAGKFRLIDFALSNCVNSGIYNIGILTQYLPHSLNDHIGIGKPWDLDRQNSGVAILQPFRGKSKTKDWYKGTAHAVYKNIDFIKNNNPEDIIILSGDYIHEMDYSKMIEYHRKKDADLTIAAQSAAYINSTRFGILESTSEFEITSFVEIDKNPPSNKASLGIYIFKRDALLNILKQDYDQNNSDFEQQIIPKMIKNKKQVYLYEYNGYWRDVNSLESYWKINLEFANSLPELDIYCDKWEIYNRSEEKPPAKFGNQGIVSNSLVSNGAIINGRVENSVISPGVYIEKGAVVRNSIVFNDSIIRKNSVIDKSIIDKEVEIKENCKIGHGDDLTCNKEKPKLLDNGLNIIAKRASIPKDTVIARNCRILSYVSEENFKDKKIPSGSTIISN